MNASSSVQTSTAPRASRSKIRRGCGYAALCVLLILYAAAVIARPDRYVACCFNGIALWAECVLPSLFPFMVITMLLVRTSVAERAARPLKKLTAPLKLPEIAAPLFAMSACSGYPAGCRTVAECYDRGAAGARGVKKLCLLCSTSGPLFVIGSVGYKMFGSRGMGGTLLAAHLGANLAVALLYSLFSRPERKLPSPPPQRGGNLLYDSFYNAVTAVTVAGGFICFFFTAAQIAADLRLLSPLQTLLTPLFGGDAAYAVCYGLIEATGGCALLAKCAPPLALPLAGFLITFGGVSILLQQLCYLTKCGVKASFFVGFKFLQATLCFVLLLPFALC